MADKQDTPIHQQVAEAVLAKVKKATREKLTMTPKSSYTAIADEDGWIVRLTPKILEANKKRLTEEQLEKAGLHSSTRAFHCRHHIGSLMAITTSGARVAVRQAQEAELEDGGLEEVVAAVEAGAELSTTDGV